jgi:hypothetical protein
MENEFDVEVSAFAIVQAIDGVWNDREFSDLLAEMEFGSIEGLSKDELREMCLLSLQDLTPEAAAALVLKYRLGDRLNDAQISNIAADMPEEKLWEEYADMALHEGLFHVSSLLYVAFPNVFPEPDAVTATVRITARHEEGSQLLRSSINESFLLRLLAGGMDEDAALIRLFEDQLAGDSLPEAQFIIWTLTSESTAEDACTVELLSSGSWLDPLRSTKSYSVRAWPDKAARKKPSPHTSTIST